MEENQFATENRPESQGKQPTKGLVALENLFDIHDTERQRYLVASKDRLKFSKDREVMWRFVKINEERYYITTDDERMFLGWEEGKVVLTQKEKGRDTENFEWIVKSEKHDNGTGWLISPTESPDDSLSYRESKYGCFSRPEILVELRNR